MLIQGLSGALLAVRPWLPNPGRPVAAGQPSSPGTIVAAAQAHLPPGLRPARYVPPAAPGQPAQVGFVAASGVRGPPLDVWVDPVSLGVPQTPLVAAGFEWLRSLHTNLLLEPRTGRSIVGYAGIGLIVLAVLGVPLWWPARAHWCEAFVVPATLGRMLHRRLHGAAGAWSVLLLLVIAATGVVTAFPQTARATLGLPQPPARPLQPVGVPPSPAEIDRAVVVATAAAPGLLLRLVVLPPRSTEPIRILLMPHGAEGVSRTVTAAVDAEGHLTSLLDPRTVPTGDQALRWAHDLHFGQGLGPVWRMLTVLTGLVLPVLGVTGAAMWLHRRRRQAPVLQPGE